MSLLDQSLLYQVSDVNYCRGVTKCRNRDVSMLILVGGGGV